MSISLFLIIFTSFESSIYDSLFFFSVALVEDGYACSHVTAERSNYGRLIAVSEENARKRKEKRWANYVEEAKNDDEEKEDDKKDEQERKVKYETVVITEVTDEAHVYAQHVDEGPKLVGLMKQLREEFSQNPPLAGAFQPKRGTHIHLYICLLLPGSNL